MCLQGQGSVVALDVSAPRLAALRDTAAAQRWGAMVRTVTADLREFAAAAAAAAAEASSSSSSSNSSSSTDGTSSRSESGSSTPPQQQQQRERRVHYDRVLLDAPCSGTGVLAKRADLRWRLTPEVLAQVQGPAKEMC